MRSTDIWSSPEPMEGARPTERETFGLIGITADRILENVELFERGDHDALVAALDEEAGLPWVHAFKSAWQQDEHEARRRAIFDLIWHRRAMESDPMVCAQDFAGFDVLLDAAREIDGEVARLLAYVDGNDPDNPRRQDGPPWWQAWHKATNSPPGGWLELDEIDAIAAAWNRLSAPEVEQACLEVMGAAYSHPGCWKLLSDLGGFFAQCAQERRVVVAEVGL